MSRAAEWCSTTHGTRNVVGTGVSAWRRRGIFSLRYPSPLFCTPPLQPDRTHGKISAAMKKDEMKILNKAWKENFSRAWAITYNPVDSADEKLHKQYTLAVVATLVDYLRGDIEGLPSPLSDLARNPSDPSDPIRKRQPPADNGDPNPIGTEVMRQLGSLGVQNLKEIKGWKLDTQKHFLLYINNRFADTGWIEGDPHIKVLSDTLASCGLSIEEMK